MTGTSPFHPHPDGVLVEIIVQPRASKTEISGIHDGALRVRVTAPPVEGAANDAIIDLLSKRLKIRKSDIQIVSGALTRRKRLLVRGIDVDTARDTLVGNTSG